LILWWSPGMHALDVAVHRGKHRVPGDVPHQRAAAIGIGKRDPTAGVRSPHPSRSKTRHSAVRTFATTTNSLLEPRDWLLAQRVSIVVMAATGDYRRPPFYLLEAALTVILVNAAHAQDLPGRASDGADAVRPAPLAECGLLRASVAPGTDPPAG
jgi:transposase